MAFIIESYNRYDSWDRSRAKYVFQVNESWYAVKEVEMEWGIPQLQERVDRDREEEARQMYVYDTYEDAMRFVVQMKQLNAR